MHIYFSNFEFISRTLRDRMKLNHYGKAFGIAKAQCLSEKLHAPKVM